MDKGIEMVNRPAIGGDYAQVKPVPGVSLAGRVDVISESPDQNGQRKLYAVLRLPVKSPVATKRAHGAGAPAFCADGFLRGGVRGNLPKMSGKSARTLRYSLSAFCILLTTQVLAASEFGSKTAT